MTKAKIIAAALAALTLAAALIGGQAQAHSQFGHGLRIGFATSALIGVASTSPAYAYAMPDNTECRHVERYDRWGNLRTFKICDIDRY
jgi:hypothetical protein